MKVLNLEAVTVITEDQVADFPDICSYLVFVGNASDLNSIARRCGVWNSGHMSLSEKPKILIDTGRAIDEETYKRLSLAVDGRFWGFNPPR